MKTLFDLREAIEFREATEFRRKLPTLYSRKIEKFRNNFSFRMRGRGPRSGGLGKFMRIILNALQIVIKRCSVKHSLPLHFMPPC